MSSAQSFKFQGSQIAVMTGFAGASPLPAITAITQASPPVVTSAAHGLTDGQVVRITGVVGMTEVNNGVFIIEELSSSTFSLLGVDATGYAAYVSGGAFDEAVLSNWCEITGYNRTGGTSPEIPTTTICSNAREFRLGLPDFGTTVIDYLFAPRTPIQIAVQGFYESGDIMAVMVTLPESGGTMVQLGFVQQTSEQAAVDGLWTASMTIRNTGAREDFCVKADQLRASILKASSPKPIRLDVDGIGPVFVRVQTAYDADVNRKKLDAVKKDDGCEIGRLLACMLCDEEGSALFDLADDAVVLQLAKLPGAAQTAILDASNKANTTDPKQ